MSIDGDVTPIFLCVRFAILLVISSRDLGGDSSFTKIKDRLDNELLLVLKWPPSSRTVEAEVSAVNTCVQKSYLTVRLTGPWHVQPLSLPMVPNRNWCDVPLGAMAWAGTSRLSRFPGPVAEMTATALWACAGFFIQQTAKAGYLCMNVEGLEPY